MRFFILALAYWISTGNSQAQSIKFYARSDASEILESSYIEVEFILENADARNFKAPSFKDFTVVSGPGRSSSTTIVNGKMSKKQGYSYTLRPNRTGSLQVGAATVNTYSGILSTEPFTIRVIEASEDNKDQNEDIFVKTMCSDSIAYVGQQLVLSYKLYTKLDVRSYNFQSENAYDNFYAEQLSTDNEPTRREIINGSEYYTKIIKRVALFPQKTGKTRIEPAAITLGIAMEKSRRSFFFSTQLKNEQVIADGLQIEVRNAPEPSPKSFSGAIGQYQMSARLQKRTVTTDDAIVVQLQVSGDGDSKTVLAPDWLENDSFDIYDPNLLFDSAYVSRGRIYHSQTYEYLIVPKYAGSFQLEPKFSYFEPDSQDYITLSEKLPPVNIIKGSGNAQPKEEKNSLDVGLVDDSSLEKIPERWHGNLRQYLLILIFIISVLGLVLYARYIKRSGKLDEAQIRKQKARSRALERLSTLKALKSSDASKFFDELARVVKEFIQDKYGIAAFQSNKSDIMDELRKIESLNDQHINMFSHLLSEAEKALYAPGLAESAEQLYEETLKLITHLED